MDRALSAEAPALPLAPIALVAGLPSFMVVFDILTRADPVAALWSMPLLVVITALTIFGLSICSGTFQRPNLIERAGLGLALWAGFVITLQAINPTYGLLRLAELALIAALATALSALARRHGVAFGAALAQALIFGVALSVPLVALAWAMEWPGGYGHLDVPGFAHIRIFGFALALALAAAAGIWPHGPKIALAAAMVTLSIALFWSGGRGGLLALILPLPILALFLPALRPGLLPLAAALVVGFCASWFIEAGASEFGLAGRLTMGGSVDDLSSGRLSMWKTLWASMAEAPILGYGLGQSRWIFEDAGYSVAHLHAHNIVLDAALALGWPGAILAIGLTLFAWTRTALVARRGTDLQATGLALISVFLTLALIDGVYVYWPGLVPLVIGIGLVQAR